MNELELTDFQKLQILLTFVAVQEKAGTYELLSVEQVLRLLLKAQEMGQPSEKEANDSLKDLIGKLYKDVIDEVST